MEKSHRTETKAVARRDFLKTGAAGVAAGLSAAAAYPAPTIAAEGAKGPIPARASASSAPAGAAGPTSAYCMEFKKEGRVEPVAVCDVYGPRVRAAAEAPAARSIATTRTCWPTRAWISSASPRPTGSTPRRRSTPCGPARTCTCEKPLTHWLQFDLAKQLADEAEKHKRIVQVGTQYMADDAYAQAKKLIREGVVGKIVHVQRGYFRRGDWGERMPIPDPNAKPGPDLDWEQFLGDAPKVPFTVSRFFQWRHVLGLLGRAGHRPAWSTCSRRSSACWTSISPSGCTGAGGMFQYDGLARCPTSSTWSSTTRAGRAWC